MKCCFCQNYQISQRAPETAWSCRPEDLAQRYLELQQRGCHNIEWVSPTQHLPALVRSLRLARAAGCTLPVVYNSNGYERPEVLRLLSGIVDVYLPDAKYSTRDLAERLSGTADYVEVNRAAILEMWRLAGPLSLDEGGVARRGVLIRHLVLPGHLAETRGVLQWIAAALGTQAVVSLMAQYFPVAAVPGRPLPAELGRRITRREYRHAVEALEGAGLEHGWIQERSSSDQLLPDFHRADPFSSEDRSPA